MSTLRVATYNIQHGLGLDLSQDIARAARVLAEIDADVIALQEVVFGPRGSKGDQAHFLASRLGMKLVPGVTRPHGDAAFGNAVLTRLPIAGVTHCDLSVGARRERRGCLRVDVATVGLTLSVFATHFGLGPGERRIQLGRLCTFLRGAEPGRRVLMGDFNEMHRGPITRSLWREFGDTEPPRVRSHPALLPVFALDRIYWDAPLLGLGPRAHRTRLSRLSSDHLPLVADLQLQGWNEERRPA